MNDARWIAVAVVAAVLGGCVVGCGSQNLIDAHVKTFDTIRASAAEVQSRMPIKSSSLHFSGSATNPGVRFSAGVEYFVQGRYEGLAGQFSGAAQGEGDREIPEWMQRGIMDIRNDTSLSAAEREAKVFDLLGRAMDWFAGNADATDLEPNPTEADPEPSPE